MQGKVTAVATILSLLYIIYARQQPLTDKSYIINTYAYIVLGLLLAYGTSVFLDNYHLINPSSIWVILIAFIVSLISMFAIFYTSNNSPAMRHVLWLIFMVAMGTILFPIYEVNKMNNMLGKSMIITIAIVVALSIVAYTQPLGIFESWGPWLFAGLLILILVELGDLIFGENTNSRFKIYSWVAIALFSGFILYDTQKLVIKIPEVISKCTNALKPHDCADYPLESLGIFLDVMNMYSNISNVNTR